jgi:hypothetical protein
MARMVDMADPAIRDRIKQKLIVWRGPLPFSCDQHPELFAQWLMEVGGDDLGMVIGDSVKDMVSSCTEDTPGMGFNDAVQRVLAQGVEFGCCHHNRKENAQNTKPRKLADVYGSRWLTAGLGSVLKIWKADEHSRELTQLKTPYGEAIKPIEYQDRYVIGRSDITPPITDALVSALVDAGADGLTEAEAVEAVRSHRSRVRRALDNLVESDSYEPGFEKTGGTRANKPRKVWRVRQ